MLNSPISLFYYKPINLIKNMKIFSFFIVSFFLFSNNAISQINPVKWDYTAKKINNEEFELTFTATIDNGWNIYSQHTDPSGPVPTSINFEENTNIEIIGEAIETGKKKEAFDELFGVKVIKFAGEVVFTQKVKATGGANEIKGYLEYMSCDDEKCLPPKEVAFNIALK